MADQDRHAKIEKLVRMGHQCQVVGVGFAETDPRIKADSFPGDARFQQGIEALLQVAFDVGHHIVIAGINLHRLRRTLHVHRADAGTTGCGQGQHAGITLQAGYIVDDLGSHLECGGGHRGLGGVDRHRHPRLRGQPAHHLPHAAQFFLGRHPGRKRAGAFPAHIEQIGSFGHQPQAMGHRRLHRGMPTAVGKAVGSGVDNPHHQRPAQGAGRMGQQQPVGAELPVVGRGGGHGQSSRTVG